MNKIAALTRSFSQYRHGVNAAETTLTALTVQKKGISHLFDCVMEGDARGTEGMPLIVPNLMMDDNEVHDVLYVCTMSNDVFAFDATTPDPETGRGRLLWKQRVGNPITNTRAFDMYLINDHWGILSTPVIDLTTNTLYCISFSSPTESFTDGVYSLHALSLISGGERCAPLVLSNATYQPAGLPSIRMGDVPRKQRSALLFDSRNGVDTVFFADSTFAMNSKPAHGFVVACDVTAMNSANRSMSIGATWTTTSRYSGAGMWMASQGLAMDDAGYLYGTSANGAFDGITDFGESFVKLKYTPKTATAAGTLVIVDWFTPYTDTGRVGADPTIPWLGLIGNDEGTMDMENMTSPGDMDLGSGGCIYAPKSYTGFTKHVVFAAGKDGILYMTDGDNMGKTALDDFRDSRIDGNYAKLLVPPYGLTYYPGDMDLAPQDISKLLTTSGGFTHHEHATSVLYKSPRFGMMLFCGGENAPVRAHQVAQNADGTFTVKYLGQGAIVASAGVPAPGGMPGTMMTLSCNGNVEDTAVLWCCNPYGNANSEITPGRLVAYGADWIDDNGMLVKIWDSADWGITFKHDKFDVPACINGKLYVPSYDGRVMVFG